jgi:nucleoside triphosphate diphosphatase
LPALARALRLQQKAASVGFDWNDARAVLAKIREEADEIESALALGQGKPDRLAEEVGDLMFAVVNLARHAGADPETALRAANAKFQRRFAAIERALAARGRSPRQSTLTEMDALWDAAKAAEREDK